MRVKNFPRFIFFIILFAFLSTVLAEAQAGRGKARISGEVVDEDGNPIKNAHVEIRFLENEEITYDTKTDKKGEWAFLGLGTGTWRITASAEGYIPSYTETYIRQLERNPFMTLTLKKIKRSGGSVGRESANMLERAGQLFKDKQYDEAIVLLEQFLEKNPEMYQTHVTIGDCYREKGDLDKAIQEYQTALDLAQEGEKENTKEITAKALAGIGECYLRKEDFEAAQDYFKQSIKAYPENEILAYNVGEIYFSTQRADEAIPYFELASQIKPDWSDPYYKLGYVYLNKGDYGKAIESFQKFLELEPDTERSAQVQNIINYLKRR